MHSEPKARTLVVVLLDLVGASLLALFAMILGPLGALRGPLVLESCLWHLVVLLPQGLLSRAFRAGVDWRLGNFDAAIVQLEFLVSRCEEYYQQRTRSRARKSVLEDYYAILIRAYLHSGHIDDGMMVVLRAKKALRCERLPGLPRLDAKTAHLVRAGLAAGRLLDGGGLATLFVKSSALESPEAQEPLKSPPIPRQGASAHPLKHGEHRGRGAKIIPFPSQPSGGRPQPPGPKSI